MSRGAASSPARGGGEHRLPVTITERRVARTGGGVAIDEPRASADTEGSKALPVRLHVGGRWIRWSVVTRARRGRVQH